MKKIIDLFIAFLIAFALFTHIMKALYILFKPKILERYKTFSSMEIPPNRLLLYYLIVVLTCVMGLNYKLKLNLW